MAKRMRVIIALLLSALVAVAPARAQYTKASLITQMQNCFPTQFVGAITPPETGACLTNLINSYQQYAGVNPQLGTSYTLQASDYGQLVTLNNAGAIAVTLPPASVLFPWNAFVSDIGAGTATITPTSGTIGGGSALALTVGQSAWIVSDGANYQIIRYAAAAVLGTMAYQNSNNVSITGGSINGAAITGLPAPVNPSDAATLAYVNSVAVGIVPHAPVQWATAAVLPNSPTYSNGTAGVGATLTAGSNAAIVVDSGSPGSGDRVLVNNQSSAFQNGIYTVTTVGSGSVPWVLTRATDFNTATAGNLATGAYVAVQKGTLNINTGWLFSTSATITIGTTALNFTQIFFAQSTAGSAPGMAALAGATGGL